MLGRRLVIAVATGAMFGLAGLGGAAQSQSVPPDPIAPDNGESQLLDIVNSLPVNDITNALDFFPVPYVIAASADGAPPTVITSKAGQPNNIDADDSKATGKGGHDIKVELNTVLFPTPRLELSIERLGTAPYATDLSVVIGFPFDAFNDEDGVLPSAPNLFVGYQTALAGGAAGGIAPEEETFVFTPDVLAGTSHLFSMEMVTTNAPNPIRFLAGHFDGIDETGILNASAISALTEPVPDSIEVALDLGESPLADPGTTSTAFGIDWTATSASTVTFNYFEEETGVPAVDDPADFATSLVVDQMPASEELTVTLEESLQALTLSHRGSAPIDELHFTKGRDDGLSIDVTATDIPTEVDLGLDLAGAATLDVNANTLDMRVIAQQRGGFLDTSDFLGYDVGYIEAFFTDAPDLTATFLPDEDRYQVMATNPGESIGSAGLLIDDGPVGVIDGGVDVDGNGVVDAADDGTIADVDVIDGAFDTDGDGLIGGGDDGAIATSATTSVAVIDGGVDLDASGVVDGDDDGPLVVLQLAPSWNDPEVHHIFSMADFGNEGTAAGRVVNVSEAALDLDAPTVIDGELDLDDNGVVDGDDDGIVAIDLAVFDGRLDVNDSGGVDGTDDDPSTLGSEVIDGRIDLDGNGVVDGDDDGPLTVHTYRLATTAAAPLQAYVRAEPGAALLPDRRIDAVCNIDDIPAGQIDFQIVFPPPDVNVSYVTTPPTGIDQIDCAGHIDETYFELLLADLPPEFEFELNVDSHLRLRAEDGTGTPNSDEIGAIVARFCYDPDWDDCNDESVDPEPPGGLPATEALFGNPLHDARVRADSIPSFLGEWGDDGRNVVDGRLDLDGSGTPDGADDGRFGGYAVIDGFVDISGDGSITGADDGRFLGKRVVDGGIDTSDDGAVDGADDGSVAGSWARFDTGSPDAELYLDGMQVDASTKVGLAPLPAADPTADHYLRLTDLGLDGTDPLEQRIAAGAFGIDEIGYSVDDGGRGLAMGYRANQDHALVVDVDSAFGGRFFPDYDIDVNLTVDDVPQTWDFFTDLATEVTYDASSGIDAIALGGTIDDTDDDMVNGTTVAALLDDLPAFLRLHLETDAVKVIDGRLDVNADDAIGAADDAVYAGFRVIDGGVDLDADGAVDGGDDGLLLGLPVIDGALDTDGSGVVDGDDDSAIAGASLRMDAPIDLVSLSLTSPNAIVGTDYQLAEFAIEDIPARWDANWGGGRFLVESRDAAGNPEAMGSFAARISTSSDETVNDANIEPFTLDGPQLGGPVLGDPGDSGGCRIEYTDFLQEIDRRYYNAEPGPDPSTVFSRLQNLYCDSEQYDVGQDHVIARMEDVNADGDEEEVGFASLQFSNFQRISWIPDADGGQFVFRAPTPGLHPLFGGFEQGDDFATVEILNIPDEVIVDIDMTGSITYDATDDVDASIQQIDFYYGPLPMAADGDTAARGVIDFPSPVVSTTDFVHIGWDLGFPNGGAFFNASEPIDILALVQDGDFRATAALELEDIHLAYGLDLFSFDVREEIGITVPCPVPPDFLCDITVPSAWELVQFEAGTDNDADAESLSLPLAENPAKATISGFLAVYDRIGGVQELDPDPVGIDAGANEFVPLVTVEGTGWGITHADASVLLDPITPDGIFCIYPACADVDISINGDVTLDIWTSADIDETFGIEDLFEMGFVNRPDYVENDPFHILPILGFEVNVIDGLVFQFDGFHDFGDHISPFLL